MLFYGVFAAFLISRRAGAILLAAWMGLIALGASRGWSDALPARYFWHPMNLLFPVGMLAALAAKTSAKGLPALTGRTGVLVFVAGNALFVAALFLRSELLVGAASFFILAGSASRPVEAFFSRRTALVYLGGASYSLYLIHYPAMSATAKLLRAAGAFDHLQAAAVFAVLVAAGVAAGVLLYRFVERPLLAARVRR
jgi:exopolysaccharide production protein ExoZ